jgi:uncharacterized repeat protein (TIGR01451 family)
VTCAVALGLLALPAGATDGPVVAVMKTAASASIEAGDVASFTITVSNTGGSPASNISITDVLPGPTLAWAENPDVGACSIADDAGGDVLSCNVGVLDAGASFSVTVEATTNPAVCDVVLANTATVEVGNKLTLTASASISVTCPPTGGGCTRTQGFWKTHYPDAWPAAVLSGGMTLGSVTYTAAQLQAIFNQPVRGNGLISLSHQLIAAKLNVGSGADASGIQSAIDAADALIGGLVVPPVGTGYLAPSSTSALNTALTNFNEGVTGPGHCDEEGGEGE